MEEQFLKQIQYWKKKGWITINENLEEGHLAALLCNSLRDMPISDFITTFAPRDIL